MSSLLTQQVAREIFGWRWWCTPERNTRILLSPTDPLSKQLMPATGDEPIATLWPNSTIALIEPPPYDKDMTSAWLVVDQMWRQANHLDLHQRANNEWKVGFIKIPALDNLENGSSWAVADMPQIAICQAALARTQATSLAAAEFMAAYCSCTTAQDILNNPTVFLSVSSIVRHEATHLGTAEETRFKIADQALCQHHQCHSVDTPPLP